MNHYDTLGVPRDATREAIKRAYRKLASQHHTDRGGGDHDAMAAINKAYETLYDQEKRARYDASGEDGPRPPTAQEKAANSVAQVITQIIDSDFDGNIVAELRKHFSEKISEAEKANKKHSAKIQKLSKRKSAITSKKSPNLIHIIIDERVAKMQKLIEGNVEGITVCKEALTFIADYADIHSAPSKSQDERDPRDMLQELIMDQLARRFR